MNGRAYLEMLISDHFGSGAGEPAESRAAGWDLAELHGVAHGLVAAGALDTDAASAILADLKLTLEALGWLPHVRFSSVFSERAPLVATANGAPRREWQELAEQAPPPSLAAVHSLAGERFTLADTEYSLIALERWTSLFRVTYAWCHPSGFDDEGRRRHALFHLTWAATDDRGKTYRVRGGGSHGGAVITFAAQDFEPRLDPEAKQLNLSIRADKDDATLIVDLSEARPRRGVSG